MSIFKYFFLFLILNFSALGIGSYLMQNGPQTDWYLSLNKAPWSPPGWVFGFAWTTIMLLFSIYMANLVKQDNSNTVWYLFALQFILNVSWNFVFFNKHMVLLALINIILLTFLVIYFFLNYYSVLKLKSFLIAPYAIWLLLASSLNAYVYFNN
ncbi:MAG TPA: TspO/MBR family protein [Flavobacteriaceae bacterium]|nr:TspO/MBR family protein [Flavobacteriaceae bacterium]